MSLNVCKTSPPEGQYEMQETAQIRRYLQFHSWDARNHSSNLRRSQSFYKYSGEFTNSAGDAATSLTFKGLCIQQATSPPTLLTRSLRIKKYPGISTSTSGSPGWSQVSDIDIIWAKCIEKCALIKLIWPNKEFALNWVISKIVHAGATLLTVSWATFRDGR